MHMKALLTLLALGWLLSASATPLIVGIGEHQLEPYVLRDEQTVTGGILKELMDELGQRLGLEVHYLLLPRKRLEQSLANGRIHLVPHTNPRWHNDRSLLWSQPWMSDQNRFVLNRNNTFAVSAFDDLNGRQLGTILGHRYGELEFWFEQNFITRSDAHTLEQSFQKLAAGRIDALIGSQRLIDYQLRTHNNPHQFVLLELVADEHQRFIALSPNAPCTLEALSNALQQMLDEGRINAILEAPRTP